MEENSRTNWYKWKNTPHEKQSLNSVGYSQVNDEQLDSFLRDIVKNHPNAGERMIRGHLISLDCKV